MQTKQFFQNCGILFAFVLTINLAYGQYGQIVGELYYSDSASGYLDYIYGHIKVEDGLIVSGYVKQNGSRLPVIIKINAQGEIVWSTLDNFNTQFGWYTIFEIALFKDGYIYGSPGTTGYNSINYIMKVDAQTGEVIFSTLLFEPSMSNTDFIDLDSSRFAIATKRPNNGSRITFMNKNSGEIISYKDFSNGVLPEIEIDANGNIYYSPSHTLQKFNADDLDQELWNRNMQVNDENYMQEIHKLFLDKFDDLYAVGQTEDSFGYEYILKMDTQTGDTIWTTNLNTVYEAVDLKDMGESLLILLARTTTGGGLMRIRKINKTTGAIELATNYYHTEFLEEVGNEQAGTSIDFDCNGDIYLTGHIAGWNRGTMIVAKINGADGSWMYDQIIKLDPTEFDYKSNGVATAVFNDQPIFLGILQEVEDTLPSYAFDLVIPTYVAMNPVSGQITAQKPLGSKYLHPSSTKSLINVDENIYALKQIGSHVAIEKYDSFGSMTWNQIFSGETMLKAGQMQFTEEHIYISTVALASDTALPYNTPFANSINLYKISRSDGSIIDSVTLSLDENQTIKLFEIEADNSSAFIFYQLNDNNYYIKWDSEGLSPIQFLETSGNNMNYDGDINIIYDEGLNLIVIGTDTIFSIDKMTLLKTPALNFEQSRDYYYNLLIGDTLFICGNTAENEQLITAIDKSDFSILWEETYESNGTVNKIVVGSENNLISLGSSENQIHIQQVQTNNGQAIWYYNEDETSDLSTPFDVKFVPDEENPYLIFTGAMNVTSVTSDLLIKKLDMEGVPVFSLIGNDELNGISRGNTIAVVDSLVWVGGSYNKISVSKAGFIFLIDHEYTTTEVADNIESNNIKFYPNPTIDLVRIDGLLPGFSYEIFDSKGALHIVESYSKTNIIDLGNLPPGLYFIKLFDQDKNETIKVVKQ